MSGNEVQNTAQHDARSDIVIDISFIKTEHESSEEEFPVKESLNGDTKACSSASPMSNYVDNKKKAQENISGKIIKSKVLELHENFIKREEEEASEGHSQLKDIEAVYIPIVCKIEDFGYVDENEDINKYEREESDDTSAVDNECSGPSGFNYSVATDDVLDNKTNTDSILTEDLDSKSKHEEDISEYEVDESETRTDTDEDTVAEMPQTLVKKHAKTEPELRQYNRTNFIKGKKPSVKHFECDQCGKTYSVKNTLIVHQRIHTGEKPFKCDHCEQTFSRRGHLTIHQRIHTGEKPFKCEHCGKTFSQGSHLTIHQRIHTGEKPFKCDHCGQTFSRRDILINHQRRHTSEKPFKCEHCGKTFSRRDNLITHQQIHTGEKPFECDHCGQTFSHRCAHASHQRIHMGDKPFRCDDCGKTFSHRQSFKTHERIHTREKPFECDHCEKAFSVRSNFITHKRMHTGEKPFKCDHCEKTFSQRVHLIRHQHSQTHQLIKSDHCE